MQIPALLKCQTLEASPNYLLPNYWLLEWNIKYNPALLTAVMTPYQCLDHNYIGPIYKFPTYMYLPTSNQWYPIIKSNHDYHTNFLF